MELWRIDGGERLHRLWVGDTVASVAFSPDGTRLAAGSWREGVRLWRFTDAKNLAPLNHWWVQRFLGESVLSVAFSPDGTLLASGNADGMVKLWALK